jgi:hypothetical protein
VLQLKQGERGRALPSVSVEDVGGEDQAHQATAQAGSWQAVDVRVPVGDSDDLGREARDGHQRDERDRACANYSCADSKDFLWGSQSRKSQPWTIYSAPLNATKLTHRVKISVAWF